jgi:hypothetical protein
MSKSMNPIAAPKTLRYEPDAGLPVAIEAKSNRRYFYPSNGNEFGPKNTNVIRMTLNANSFLDFSHSYPQFTVTNNNAANETVGLDHGAPFFSRLQVMSGGQELEDIQEYSRLYSMLTGIQGSRVTSDETSLTQHQPFAGDYAAPASALGQTNAQLTAALAAGGSTTSGLIDAAVDAAINRAINDGSGEGASYKHNANTQVAQNGSVTYNIPLISAFFNIDKYFPLLLTEQGLDLYFYLEQPINVGVWSANAGNTLDYKITEFKYVAHEVNLDDAFVNQMKSSMQATGGVLSLSSTTYKYNNITGTTDLSIAGPTQESLNISCRVKSLKGMLVRPQAACFNNDHLGI